MRTTTNQNPAFTMGEFLTNTFQGMHHSDHPKCCSGCPKLKPNLNHLAGSQTNLPRKMSTMWENLLASPQIYPALQKCCEVPSSKNVCSLLTIRDCWSGVFSPTSLSTTSSKAGISVLFTVDTAGLKVVAFSIGGAVKMKLLCPLALAFLRCSANPVAQC